MTTRFQSGQELTASLLNRVIFSVLQKITGDGAYIQVAMKSGRISIQPGPALLRRQSPVSGLFGAEYRNYIEITRGGETEKVAKPTTIRHSEDYEGLTSFTSTAANTADVSDGDTDESWQVYPSYEEGNIITAIPLKQTITDDSGTDFTCYWVEVSSRRWAKVES